MNRAMFSNARFLALFSALVLSLVVMGCPPSNNNNNNPDGGTNPDTVVQVSCQAGDVCLTGTLQGVRSCDVMIQVPGTLTGEQVLFGADVIGRFMRRGDRIGMAFLWRQNQDVKDTTANVVIRLPQGSKTDPKAWKIEKQTCYDESGKVIDKPLLSLNQGQ